MTIPVPIIAGLIAAAAAVFIAVIGAWGSINSRLGKLEKGYEMLAAEIRASRERSDMQHAVAMERLAAVEERAIARHTAAMEAVAAVEERAIARHTAAMEAVAAVEERAIARETAAEERALAREAAALARHNELMAEIRLWRTHGHDADGNIFFRVPE